MKRKKLVELSKNTPNFELLGLANVQRLYFETYGDSISKAHIIKTLGKFLDRIMHARLPDLIIERINELAKLVGGIKSLKRILNRMS